MSRNLRLSRHLRGLPGTPTPVLRGYALAEATYCRVAYAPVAHEPWDLRSAAITRLDDGLVEAAGLPPPSGSPLAHVAAPVSARVGRLRVI